MFCMFFFKDMFFLFWVGVRISDWLDCCFDSWIDEFFQNLPPEDLWSKIHLERRRKCEQCQVVKSLSAG